MGVEAAQAAVRADAAAYEVAATNALEDGFTPRPSYSRWARRERLQAALTAASEGADFVIPEPELIRVPGPCGAVLN
eukprot:3654071-Prymnesium_polylepis.1